MVKDCKLYECDICGRKETVEEGYEPNDIVPFEVYSLKPCICKRCLKLAINAYGIELKENMEKKDEQ
jgi:hypothetical protein